MSTGVEKKIAELNKMKAPIVVVDESLDKYDNVIPFPEKHEKMNEILKKTGHPENYLKSK
ncbi:MAG TPA: hypothetical protein VFE53_20120 [Mucilaginibacter sp.]|jgi:hypothetical protein|nr:hypothetical protein [Mucilaginibacter sp.]